jgi:hypothetical protein
MKELKRWKEEEGREGREVGLEKKQILTREEESGAPRLVTRKEKSKYREEEDLSR